MKDIEKNDVDVSKLFIWTKDTEIEFNGKKTKAYIRLVGDAELNRARVFAIRKSAELRKLLKNKESDEYIAYIPDQSSTTKDELINGLLVLGTKLATQEAMKEISLPIPAEPSADSTLEEQEKYQELVDNYPEEREKLVRELVIEKLNKLDESYKKQDEVKLYELYVEQVITQLCETEMLKRFREMCAYFGTYQDKKLTKRLFDSFDEFDNVNTDVKSFLINEYVSLEIDGEVLKKSLEATQ